ncbi:alpha/beta hydrolase family protein [Paenibacillus sp. IITD108]|uniref:alpha/beta hydrolase family protein n=1 Tax=Paenibacillus sp. IITD108 TaxID=3116649 RepID=UPI002F3F47B5
MNQRLKQLPNILLNAGGGIVSNKDEWAQKRRKELVELFRTHVYGRTPVRRPESMRIAVKAEDLMMDGLAVRKKIEIQYEGPGGTGKLPFVLFIPAKADKPVPAFVLINNRGTAVADPDRKQLSGFWPAELLIEREYAAAVFQVEDVDPDVHDEFRNGVHGLFDPPLDKRPGDAWGTIAAWAWGASRVMDALEEEAAIDASRIALAGHSRGGKTALWAGAEDERFAMVVSNNSGCTGAALSRGKQGERISHINASFPHWFAENYKQYNDREDELPVDQHMLLGLIAPRLLYVSSATEDSWADPESEFLSLIAVQPIYKLHGYDGIGAETMPAAETPISSERLGYHLRTGDHDLTEYDWRCFIDFADANLI